MDVNRQALIRAQSFLRELYAASTKDVASIREVLAAEASPESRDALARELSAYRDAAPAMLATVPPEVRRALALLGDLIENADQMSDDELLAGLRAFSDMFTPVVFEPPT